MKKISNKKGFTLIEVIVVIAVLGLVLPALFSIVFSLLKQQVQIYELSEVKRQGDSALSTVQTILRPIVLISDDAAGTNVLCASPGRYPTSGYSSGALPDGMFFKDKDNNVFQFYVENNQLKYVINGSADNLTSTKVKVTSLQIACERKAIYSPTTLTFMYQIQFNTELTPNPTLNYRTKIVLRNN